MTQSYCKRAGDVIPEVVSVVKDVRTGKEKKWVFPKKVSMCGGDGSIERVAGTAAFRCKYRGGFAEQRRKFEHFVSKKAFDIEGLGKEQVAVFLEKGLIQDFADIFTLKEGDILSLERFGEKSVENLLKAINDSRNVPLHRLLVGLSIDQVGEENSSRYCRAFSQHLMVLLVATQEELERIDGVGGIVAESVVSWFKNNDNKKLLEKLIKEITIEKIRIIRYIV